MPNSKESAMANQEDSTTRLVHPPKPSGSKEINPLGYIESHDGVLGKDYAFAIYQEVDSRKGDWKLKIRSKETANTSIDPGHPGFRRRIAEAARAGQDYFVMGFSMEPREDDPRLVQSRIYFNEALQPERLQLHLVTRNSDGSAGEEKVARVDWPAAAGADERVLSLPAAGANEEIEELAYLNSYDVIANKDYAFLAYKKTDRKDGDWVLKVKSHATASTTIDPGKSSFRRKIEKAAEQGEEYITMGFAMSPKADDPRLVENRIYFNEALQPSAVEIHLVTRNADGSPTDRQVAGFDWPL
jgi:hypothetical protein